MPNVHHIIHKLWGVRSTLLVRSEGTAVIFSSITTFRIYIEDFFQHVQPDFYAQLYIGRYLEMEVRLQVLVKGVWTKDYRTMVGCLALCIPGTGQVKVIEHGCRTSTYISTNPIKWYICLVKVENILCMYKPYGPIDFALLKSNIDAIIFKVIKPCIDIEKFSPIN